MIGLIFNLRSEVQSMTCEYCEAFKRWIGAANARVDGLTIAMLYAVSMNQKASLAVRPEEGAPTARSVAARMQWPLADLVQSFQRQVRPLAERQVVAAYCRLRSADTWATLRLRGIGGLSGSEHNAGSIHWGFGKRRAQREQNMTMQQFPMPSSDRIGLWLV